MRLTRLGEFGAIELVRSLCKKPGRDVKVGIGDDAAAFAPGAGLTLASTDMMVGGVHFDLGYTSFRDLGYKAVSSNLSDIAAMGGRPRFYLVSVALDEKTSSKSLAELYAGMEDAAGPHGVRLIGGDTVGTPGPVTVSVSILGEAQGKGPVRRSTARPGDDIYVTGTLGDSAGGLELMKAGSAKKTPGARYLAGRHLRPEARVAIGMLLGGSGLVTSMIDVSDGLSSDLGHILDASGVGAELGEELIPLSDALAGTFGRKKALSLAISGGEDYELVFTARPRARKKIAEMLSGADAGITVIGRITEQKGAYLLSPGGRASKLRPGGYEHFRK